MIQSYIAFERMHPAELRRAQLDDIAELRSDYYQASFEAAGYGAVVDMPGFLALTGGASWEDPNADPFRRSLRANPQVTLALDSRDRVLGYAYTADDVSSNRPGIIGKAEELAKMNLPVQPLIGSRYLWLRALIAPYDERGIPEGLGIVATATHDLKTDGKRPVSCYPWTTERDLIYLLETWGMSKDPASQEQPEEVPIAGNPGLEIGQLRMTGPSITSVHVESMKAPLTPSTAIDRVLDMYYDGQ